MKTNLIEFTKRPFIRNVIIMVTGTAAAQFLNILFQPVITRIYGPEAYGLLGGFLAIITLIAPISALTYPIAIVLPKSDTTAKKIIRLSLYITILFSVSAGLVLLVFNQQIVTMFQIDEIAPFLFLVPLSILFYGLSQITEQWFFRTKQFGITAKVNFIQTLVKNVSNVGIGTFYPVATVLIVLTTIGNAIKALLLILFARRSNYKSPKEEIDQYSIMEIGKRYRDFPLYRAPQAFIYEASQSLPILVLTGSFGPASAGFYTICRTVLGVPSTLLGKSVADVFYPRISEAANKGENVTQLIKKATIGLGAVGILPFGIIVILGPWLFSLVFGTEWNTAGEYARWMALEGFFLFVNRPCTKALPIFNAQRFHLIYTFLVLIIRIGALAIGYYLFSSDMLAIAFLGVSGAIVNIFLMIYTFKLSKKYDRQSLR